MKSEVNYGHYIVCMMDLLGQKEMYKVLESYPIGDGNLEFTEQLIKFIRVIEYFKRDVDSFFEGTNEYESRLYLPPSAQELLSKSRKNICKTQRFSDGILIYVSLASTTTSFPVSSVLNALLCTASTMLVSLAKGHPIRVGVAIGGAVELEDGELFGPAIGHAHDMESRRAIYPRIAVHENVVSYLNSYIPPKTIDSSTIEQKLEYEMSKLCSSAIKKDNDGEYFLDYLGEHVWEYIFHGGHEELLKSAFDFIANEKKYFEIRKNKKLLQKYSYLYNYFLKSKYEVLKK